MPQAVKRGGNLPDNQSGYRNKNAGFIILNKGTPVDQADRKNTYYLFNKLRKSRYAGFLSAQIKSYDTAVYGGERECIGKKDEKLRGSCIL